jgi:hypothetical protein
MIRVQMRDSQGIYLIRANAQLGSIMGESWTRWTKPNIEEQGAQAGSKVVRYGGIAYKSFFGLPLDQYLQLQEIEFRYIQRCGLAQAYLVSFSSLDAVLLKTPVFDE